MSAEKELTLAEQRRLIREQLQVQRQRIAEQFAPASPVSRYPRSMTMRVLTRRPALLGRLVPLLAGARFAGTAVAVLGLFQMLRVAVAFRARKPLPALQVRDDIHSGATLEAQTNLGRHRQMI